MLDYHIWNQNVGGKYRIQEVLCNPELLGNNKPEIRRLLKCHKFYSMKPQEWIYELKEQGNHKYYLTLIFEEDKLMSASYNYIKYK